ncbi:MAG: metal-dependent transcriptional regulator [Thermoplasmatota archaeon]
MAATEQMEEYLETIYRLEEQGSVARTGEIAAQLGVAPPSVTDMVQKLEKAGFVEYEPYRGVHLTETGRAVGQKILGRHRVMQVFLQEVCGMDHAEAHEAACGMEHWIPDALHDWMDGFLTERRGVAVDQEKRVADQVAAPDA